MNTVVELRAGIFLACSLWALAPVAEKVGAQSSAKSDTERVNLVVRPHVGDTLWLLVEQTMETRSVPVTESRRQGNAAGTIGPRAPAVRGPEYGPVRDPSISQTTQMRLNAHSLVESSDLKTTWLSATTDSLFVRTGTGGQLGPERAVRLSSADRRTRVNVTPDGAMSIVEAGANTAAMAASLAGMPPMLPGRAVSVGDQWERDIVLPSLPMVGLGANGVVHARFRLDSLTRAGRLAYVSLTGTLRREGAARDLPPGTQVATAGVLRGYLILDRTRGWITEAQTVIEVQSDVTPAPGDEGKARSLDIRLLQRVRVR
ncbi:MAG: hypothetical protein H7Z40_18500 [Phycisphaerae bacterium]|nr:hypothetical protein [Gemmatimonadaceae bacterium]